MVYPPQWDAPNIRRYLRKREMLAHAQDAGQQYTRLKFTQAPARGGGSVGGRGSMSKKRSKAYDKSAVGQSGVCELLLDILETLEEIRDNSQGVDIKVPGGGKPKGPL